MKHEQHLTKEYVLALLQYVPETGELLRKKARPRIQVGSVAGSINPQGYRYIQLDGRKYASHRLVWLIEYGKMPTADIDHIDGNKLNNRISNLRDATRKQNCENKGAQSNNSVGYRGVTYNKRLRKYVAQIQHYGKNRHLGVFAMPEDAYAAYVNATQQLFTHHQPEPLRHLLS